MLFNPTRKIAAAIFYIAIISLLSLGCEKIDKFSSGYNPFKKQFQPQGTVIAKVGDLSITLEQLNQEIAAFNELNESPEAKITTQEQKKAYLNEELVRRYLLYLEAKQRRLDEQPKVQEILANLEINVLANQLIQGEIANISATSSEIEDFYNIYKDQFQQEEERRIREMVFDTQTAANDTLIELLKGTDFVALAKERSIAASASKGGDLGMLRKGQRGAEFSRFDVVAFSPSLEVGQVSNVFKDKGGYYIVKVEGKKGGQARPLSEVWDEIKSNVIFVKQQQKLQEITGGLLKKTKVAIYEDKIR